MSRKTKLKLNRMRFNLKRYVFSGRYFVRNALFLMILATVVSIGIVGIGLLKSSGSDESVEAEEAEITEGLVLKVEAPSMIADISRDELNKIINDEQKVEVAAKEAVVLAKAKYDMTGRFIAIEDAVNIRDAASESGHSEPW